MKIEIIPEEIHDLANKLNGYQEQIKTKVDSFYKVIDAVEQDFDSKEVNTYLNIVRNDYKDMLNNLNELVSYYAKYMESVPNCYNELDEYYLKTTIEA